MLVVAASSIGTIFIFGPSTSSVVPIFFIATSPLMAVAVFSILMMAMVVVTFMLLSVLFFRLYIMPCFFE